MVKKIKKRHLDFFFRLLYYNFGNWNDQTYEKFVNFGFIERKISFREQFKEDKEFVINVEKLLKFSKICIEDYGKDIIYKELLINSEQYNIISKVYYNLSDTSIWVISDVSKKINYIMLKK